MCERVRNTAEQKLPVALFANFRCTSCAVAQVVQLRATNITMAEQFKLGNSWAVHWEGALYSDAVAEFANRVGLGNA